METSELLVFRTSNLWNTATYYPIIKIFIYLVLYWFNYALIENIIKHPLILGSLFSSENTISNTTWFLPSMDLQPTEGE